MINSAVCNRDAGVMRVMARYAHAIDDGDVDAVLASVTEDCRIEYDGGAITLCGHDEIRAHLGRMLVGASTHLLSNLLVEPAPEGAMVRAAAIVCAAREPGRVLIRGVQYLADCILSDDGWKIIRLRHRSTWQTSGPAEHQ